MLTVPVDLRMGNVFQKQNLFKKKTRKISVLVIQIHPKKYKFSNEFPRKC